MNEKMVNLEKQMNDLSQKLGELELRSSQDVKNCNDEMNCLKLEFELIKKEFIEFKESVVKNIDKENYVVIGIDIETILNMFEKYWDSGIVGDSFSYMDFDGYQIKDSDFRIEYGNEINLESATINLGNYYIDNYPFTYETFSKFVVDSYSEYSHEFKLLQYIKSDLFDTINSNILDVVRNFETNDFVCDDDCYCEISLSDKSIELESITINDSQFLDFWNSNFDYSQDEIREFISAYFNIPNEL